MYRIILKISCQLLLVSLLVACSLNPENPDEDLNNTLPEAKVSLYSVAIKKMGMMSIIYGTSPLAVMSKDIADNTGSATSTAFEIPRDITEMVKSTLNAIGGNITYIQYDPGFTNDAKILEFIALNNIKRPDVIVSGGITEFDRGMVTKGDTSNADISSGNNGLTLEDKNQASLSQVTLDFNLIDFKTSAGFPRIQAVNGIKLHKAVKEDSIAFTIKSITFGAKGSIKKVQGRHAAVRLLVELSMLQLLSRYQKLPYWRLIPNVEPDEVVLDQVKNDYYEMNAPQRIAQVQTFLYLYGYAVRPNGQMDAVTRTSLSEFNKQQHLPDKGINEVTYLALYENVPIDAMTQAKRKALGNVTIQTAAVEPMKNQPEPVNAPVDKPKTQEVMVKPVKQTQANQENGQLKLSVNKKTLNIGENLTVNFTVNKKLYVRIAYINSKGEMSSLFPNPYQSDNLCEPDTVYQIPPNNGDFKLTVAGPAGIDKIRAIASEQKIAADELFFNRKGELDDSKMSKFNIRAQVNLEIH